MTQHAKQLFIILVILLSLSACSLNTGEEDRAKEFVPIEPKSIEDVDTIESNAVQEVEVSTGQAKDESATNANEQEPAVQYSTWKNIRFDSIELLINDGNSDTTLLFLPIEFEENLINLSKAQNYFDSDLIINSIEFIPFNEETFKKDTDRHFGHFSDIDSILTHFKKQYPFFKYDDLSKYQMVIINSNTRIDHYSFDSTAICNTKFLVQANVRTSELVDPKVDNYYDSRATVEYLSIYSDRNNTISYYSRRRPIVYKLLNDYADLARQDIETLRQTDIYQDLLTSLNPLEAIENKMDRALVLMNKVNKLGTYNYDEVDPSINNAEYLLRTGWGQSRAHASLMRALGEDLGLNISLASGKLNFTDHTWNIVWPDDDQATAYYFDATLMVSDYISASDSEDVQGVEYASDFYELDYDIYDPFYCEMKPCDENFKAVLKRIRDTPLPSES